MYIKLASKLLTFTVLTGSMFLTSGANAHNNLKFANSNYILASTEQGDIDKGWAEYYGNQAEREEGWVQYHMDRGETEEALERQRNATEYREKERERQEAAMEEYQNP